MKQIIGFAITLMTLVCAGVPGQVPGSSFSLSSGESVELSPSGQLADFSENSAPFSTGDLIEIALIFSGVSHEHRGRYRSQIRHIVAEAKSHIAIDADPYEIGEMILTYLHDTVFRGYDESQTYIDVLLDSGLYNSGRPATRSDGATP